MFAAPEDPNGPPALDPPALDPPVTEPVATVVDRGRRPSTARRRVVLVALVLVVLVVAGVSVALLSGGPTGGPPPVSGAAAGSAPPAGQPTQGGGKQGGGKQGGGQQAGGTALLIGSVVSNAGGTLVVAPDGGGPNVTVHTDTSTRMLGTGRRTPADLPPGARAVVRVSGSGDTARAVSVSSPQTRLTGTITALTGGDLTVQQGNGLSVSVNVAAVTPAPDPPLAVGDLVAVTGTPNGTSITAGRVRVLPRAS